MIKISAAIFTDSPEQLESHLTRYIDSGIDMIDIDIQELGFSSYQTIDVLNVLSVLSAVKIPSNISIGFDLKLSEPESAVKQIMRQQEELGRDYRIYVYSTANIDFIDDPKQMNIGLGILGNIKPRGIDFLSRFPEVQFMTIRSEQQGTKLDPYLLDRVTEIRMKGYSGLVSIDGGVNLDSAELVNAYAKEISIDRVSVGSYFQKHQDIQDRKIKLDLALNIGIES